MNQRPRQGHPLFLSAGKRCRPFMCTIGQTDRRQRFQRGAAPLAAFQTEANVIDHFLPRQQTRILKHQAGIFARLGQRRVARQQFTVRGGFQPGQQAQQGTFTAAAAADHRDKLAGWNM